MQSLLTFLSLATFALAITITKPAKNDVWDSSESNTITWSAVATDPQTVDIYLSHLAAWPPTSSLLFANVPTSKGSAVVSGLQLPNGVAYQINLVAHDKPEQIYAQSQQFNITGEAVAASSTLDGYTGPTYTKSSGSATRTTLSTLTTSTGTSTETGTSTPTSEGASETGGSAAQGAESGPSQASSGSGSSTSSGTPRPTSNAAVGNSASAPLAALVFGVAAFFL